MNVKELNNEKLVMQTISAAWVDGSNDYNSETVEKCRAELLRRLAEGEKAIKELEDLKLSYESFVGHHEATMEDLESLKCCGNCSKRFRYDCPLPTDEGSKNYKYDNNPDYYCPSWQSDGLTRGEREK